MFRRETDREVFRRLGQRSLDIGADRIARTAHMAVSLLAEVRRLLGEPLDLAWEPAFDDRVAAIEVYPSATLKAHAIRNRSYKRTGDRTVREEMLLRLAEVATFECDLAVFKERADALDALICAIAGADFLNRQCIAPADVDRAHVEGWIWVRNRK